MVARVLPLAAAFVALAPAAGARGATLTPDRLCYFPKEPMTVAGTDWAPGSAWTVGGALTGSGTADDAGAFLFETRAPAIPASARPRTFRISGTQDGAQVAQASFKVVSFLVVPKDVTGKPTGRTTWRFSGFAPGRPIFIHVQRKGRTYTNKVGRGDPACGTLKTRLRRLPAVPQRKIAFGTYKVFVDNSRLFSKRGLQFRAQIKIERV